jgi:murein DD-endopeptidase MepM/ murein hydrolase activator NlpD
MRLLHVTALTGCMLLTGCLSNPLEQAPAPLTSIGGGQGAGSAGVHTVQKGDTVYRISERYRVDMPAIISVNSLSAPYLLDVGQRLQLPPPNKYEVRRGDTLYGISRLFAVTQTEIARLNNLHSPYTLKTGQILNLPSGAEKQPQRITVASNRSAPKAASVPVTPVSVSKAAPRQESYIPAKLPSSPGKFMTPVPGKLVSSYGAKKDGLHNDGINIAAPRGTPVKTAADGQVVYAGNALKGYGNLILVKHGGGYLTAYGHLGRIMVKKGEMLKKGQTLGTVGTSGQVSSPQLHFEIRKGTTALNPQQYI